MIQLHTGDCREVMAGLAAIDLGRSFIGIEKEEVFSEIARNRLSGSQMGLAL